MPGTVRIARIGRLYPLLLVFLTLAGCASGSSGTPENATTPGDATVIYLVRHAEVDYETAVDRRNPPLTPVGLERAGILARSLGDAGLDAVFSSDFERTRTTAQPVAGAAGLQVTQYDPRALEPFAQELRGRGGRLLVVGHSNTTPELVQHLGGDPGEPIDESEYDRLYIVTIGPDGTVSTVLLRYGPEAH